MTARWIILTVALLMTSPVYAQQYPYCAQFSDGSSLDCGFTSLQMCLQSTTGQGGICINNPGGPSSGPPRYRTLFNPMPFRGSPVPPPPTEQQASSGSLALPPPAPAQQASGPLPLPDAPPPPCNPLIDGTYCASAGGIQSVSSDLGLGGEPPATLGAATFSGDGSTCIGLFRQSSCGGI
jgi:Protein of unknown function (DUF3551)